MGIKEILRANYKTNSADLELSCETEEEFIDRVVRQIHEAEVAAFLAMGEDGVLTPEVVNTIAQKHGEEAVYYDDFMREVIHTQAAYNELKHKVETTNCPYCGEKPDGAMLTMGNSMAHSDCVIQKLNELLDPDFYGEGKPSSILVYKGEIEKLINNLPDMSEEEIKESYKGLGFTSDILDLHMVFLKDIVKAYQDKLKKELRR